MSDRTHPASLLCLAVLLLLGASVVAGCSGSKSSDASSDPNSVSIHNKAGKTVQLRVEIADDEPEREKGLSGRTQLDANSGMLFLLDDRHAGFWMLDTLIPLSAAFISSCGDIQAIVEMQPNSLEIHNTPKPYRFGLEANAGWFAKNGVVEGDTVEIPKALKQPGCK